MTMTASLGPHLPFLRRYARALSGSQSIGDTYVKASLEALLEGHVALDNRHAPRVALYQLFHKLWLPANSGASASHKGGAQTPGEQHLQALLPTDREALLLTAVEGFSISETATILELPAAVVQSAITAALSAINRELASNVLIVEDEIMIALDIESIVEDLGHHALGIARTRDTAVRMAKTRKPDLLLSDIQLADGSSGLDAAEEILRDIDIPVIFITAYPERLLTGERHEPTYIFSKPFSRDAVKAMIAHALFFHKSRAQA